MNNENINRQSYINQLDKYRNIQLVKILSGIRRCGKSTLLEMYKQHLLRNGIPPSHIIHRNYSAIQYEDWTAKQMFDDIISEMHDADTHYLLLDEVQEINGWERTVNTLLETNKTDIYITGSNSRLMSSELSTYLTGRYVQIPIYTLSFREYRDFCGANQTRNNLFQKYLRQGGFPITAIGNFDDNSVYQIVEDIFSSVVTKDISKRHNISNTALFDKVVRFVLENVGKNFSANSIVKFLKGQGRSINPETVYNYLDWLERAFVIYRCNRYDIQGKNVLKTQEKYYLADSSLKYALLGYNPTSAASMLENIVYLELCRRGYEVYTGKDDAREIDFVGVRQNDKIYIQVCRQLPENSDREIGNLKLIKDNYPKYVLTLDEMAVGNIDGIIIADIREWLER